jgi:2-polyprenyl-3-methyl-5-hydroxy-6-metoxy-1,4-benzoquinol methylase
MGHLNQRGCVSCPQVYVYGTIGAEDLLPHLNAEQRTVVGAAGKDEFPFIVEEYLKCGTTLNLADMILSMIEQKNLGVYHGDPRPENFRVDEDLGICYFIDYDQAEILDDKVMDSDNLDFFKWCDTRAQEKYGFLTFLNYFPTLNFDQHFMRYFRDSSFNMGATTIFSRQQTTLAECGIYHSLRGDTIFSDGERDISDRRALLDAISFDPGERVLDVGCNAGLVSMYLRDRGCEVTGIDLDQSIIYGARFVANILRKDIRYGCVDLDVDGIPGEFDTVMLFSVIHHTRNMADNAAQIAASCKRILIECRLKEIGAKPEDGVWNATSKWEYATVEDLIAGLENLFPGFKLAKNHGQGDRQRFLLELVKH